MLYLLDLYILARRGIATLPDSDVGQNFAMGQNDSLILGFIFGLLVMPAASTIIISVVIFFVGTLYQICYSLWFLPSGSRIAVPMLEQILHLITSFFAIEFSLGRIIRMMIGIFWMIIGLSIFRYQSPRVYSSYAKMTQNLTQEEAYFDSIDWVGEEVFIKNYAVIFLLLFDPIISLSAIYYLRFVMLPL